MQKIFPKDYQKIIELYSSGLTIEEIGDVFSVSVTPIKNILKNHSIKIRGCRIEFSDSEKEKIIKFYSKGDSLENIGKSLGVSCFSTISII